MVLGSPQLFPTVSNLLLVLQPRFFRVLLVCVRAVIATTFKVDKISSVQ